MKKVGVLWRYAEAPLFSFKNKHQRGNKILSYPQFNVSWLTTFVISIGVKLSISYTRKRPY